MHSQHISYNDKIPQYCSKNYTFCEIYKCRYLENICRNVNKKGNSTQYMYMGAREQVNRNKFLEISFCNISNHIMCPCNRFDTLEVKINIPYIPYTYLLTSKPLLQFHSMNIHFLTFQFHRIDMVGKLKFSSQNSSNSRF